MPSGVCRARNAAQQGGKCVYSLYVIITIRQHQTHQTVFDRSVHDIRRPKPFVKHPVCVLAKRDSVTGMVVAAVSELVNMRSFHDASTVNCHKAVASKCTSVMIRGNDGQAKSGFSAAFTRCFIKSGVLLHDCVWWHGQPHKLIQRSAFREIHEILGDQESTHFLSKIGVV